MPSTSSSPPGPAAVLPLKLYVHVVPSAVLYCEHQRDLAKDAEQPERGSGADDGRPPRKRARAAAEDCDPEKENKDVSGDPPPGAEASALDYDPSRNAKLLMVFSGEAATIRDLREDVLEKYKRTFNKVRKVGYIECVYDKNLFAVADEYRLRDCFRDGDHVVVVGTRTRIVRMRRSLVTADKAAPARRTIVKKEPSDNQVLVDQNTNPETDGEEPEDEAYESVREDMVDETDAEGGAGAEESAVFPDDGRVDAAAERTHPSVRASLRGDENINSTISAGADLTRKGGDYSTSHQTRKSASTTTPVAKVTRRKKSKVAAAAGAEEREFWRHGDPSPLPAAEGMVSSVGTSIAAKKPRKKAKAAAGTPFP